MAASTSVPSETQTGELISFTAEIACRGFHFFRIFWEQEFFVGQPVVVQHESDPDSLQHDRFACAVKCVLQSGVLHPVRRTVGHIPLEISKYFHHFLSRFGTIEGKVEDTHPRRSPIPSGGLEIKLKLTFRGPQWLVIQMREFIKEAYSWDYTGLEEIQF